MRVKMIDDTLVAVARRAATAIGRQQRRDVEIVEAIVRVLEHPAHKRLAERLRNLILNPERN